MLEVKVEVKGKNQNCSADSSTIVCITESKQELFSRDLGEIIYCAEQSGYMFTTDEVYRDAMELFDAGFKAGRTYRCLLSKVYNDSSVKISIKLVD